MGIGSEPYDSSNLCACTKYFYESRLVACQGHFHYASFARAGEETDYNHVCNDLVCMQESYLWNSWEFLSLREKTNVPRKDKCSTRCFLQKNGGKTEWFVDYCLCG